MIRGEFDDMHVEPEPIYTPVIDPITVTAVQVIHLPDGLRSLHYVETSTGWIEVSKSSLKALLAEMDKLGRVTQSVSDGEMQVLVSGWRARVSN